MNSLDGSAEQAARSAPTPQSGPTAGTPGRAIDHAPPSDGVMASNRGGNRRLLRPMLVVSALTLSAQIVAVATQSVVAWLFGAGQLMDAYLAGTTLPLYVTTVVTGALVPVFIPVFVEYTALGREGDAWRIASSIINVCLLVLGGVALGGIVFAAPLLRLTVPGLSEDSIDLAARVAMISWPTIVATGAVSLLTGVYQARERFTWPATVAILGAILNLTVLTALSHVVGVIGIAIASGASAIIQAALLLRIAFGPGRYRPVIDWHHAGVQEVLHLLTPLVISGLFMRWTPVIDRFFASTLEPGSIAQLGYAFRLVTFASLLLSTGITTVVFPRMAFNVAVGDLPAMRRTISLGLRVVWLAVAPAIALGAVLALPLVSIAFRHGRFGAGDAEAVAGLLRIYLLALAAMCLGNITGRAFYSLKRMRLIAVVGVIEAVAYVGYTALLAYHFGVVGVAVGYVLYFDLSIFWHFAWIRSKTGRTGGQRIVVSFVRTGLAAVGAAGAAWVTTFAVAGALWQLALGGVVGLIAYAVLLSALRSDEMREIRSSIGAMRSYLWHRRAVMPDR